MLWKSLASTALLLSAFAATGRAGSCSCTCPSQSSTGTCSPSSTQSGTSAPSGSSQGTGSPTSSASSSSNSSTTSGPSSGPQFVIYSDKWVTTSLPDVQLVKGYTVFALSFLLSTGPADQAQGWAQIDATTRKQLKQKYNDAGIKVIVSAFGGTDAPTSLNADPTTTANSMGQWVIDNGLDGIDVDYEDFSAMNNGKAEAWLITFTKALRAKLPQGKYIITHAPVAPWFSSTGYPSGAYRAVHKEVGNMIDWYNIQFYNQNNYVDCNSLLFKSSSNFPGTSLEEIAQSGIPQEKLIIGKPATPADASNGYIDPGTLATCLQQAKDKGWTGGAMVWQYPNADAKWIQTVRSKSWPVGS